MGFPAHSNFHPDDLHQKNRWHDNVTYHSLKCVVALRLEHRLAAASGPERVLKSDSLAIEDEPTRMKIRDGNVSALNMNIERQKNHHVDGNAMTKLQKMDLGLTVLCTELAALTWRLG